MFRTRLTLTPGAPGTKRLLERYGSRLVCVRYRYDEEKRRRLKTVELVEEEAAWTPSAPFYLVQIAWAESELRERVKALGGVWEPRRKLWRVTQDTMRRLKLEGRIRAWMELDPEDIHP